MASLSGKVSYNGKPLKGGSVSFISTEGLPSDSGAIKEDGTYTVPNITSGKYKVCVDTSFLMPPQPRGAAAPPPSGQTKAPPKDAVIPEGYKPSSPADMAIAANSKKFIKIPPKYMNAEQTDLSIDIKGGSQTYDIDLK